MRGAEEDADRARSELLSRVSHELRTPLNAVLGFAQLLDTDPCDGESRDTVDHILAGGKQLLALIDEVLDITRVEAGRLKLSLLSVRLCDAVSSVCERVAPLAERSGILLDQETSHLWLRSVRADRERLEQALQNLVTNAIQYNRAGGSVQLAVEQREDHLLAVTVTDAGMGIAPEMIPRLFTPFERLDAEQMGVEGAGLGLVLARTLVQAMGGAIEVASEVGVGSTFSIVLNSSPDQVYRPATSGANGTEADSVRTIVQIEDNPSNVVLMESIMKRRPGVRLVSAMRGDLGLEMVRRERPGLVLLDLNLPDMPGREVLQALRADPESRNVPVIIVSADATPEQIDRLMAEGATAYVTKPFSMKGLLRTVDDALAA